MHVPNHTQALEAKKATATDQAKTTTVSSRISPIELAWFMILESVQTQTEANSLAAKQLKANTNDQNALINEIGDIKLVEIPSLKQKVEKKHGVKITVNINGPEVAAAQVANQQQTKKRESLQNGLVALRQDFQTGSTGAGVQINEMLQSISQGSFMLKILKKASLKIDGKQSLAS